MEILFARPACKKDWVGKAIVLGGKLATGEAHHSHVGIKIGNLVYESLVLGGVSCRNYKTAYENRPHDLIRIPKMFMPASNERAAKRYLEGLIGQFDGLYGMGKIPLLAMDSIVSFVVRKRIFWFTQTFGVMSFKVCSNLVAYILYKFGNGDEFCELFKNWRSQMPDDNWDILTAVNKRVLTAS